MPSVPFWNAPFFECHKFTLSWAPPRWRAVCCKLLFKMQAKHAARSLFPLDAHFRATVFHFRNLQQIDRLTSCNKVFFDPSRTQSCTPLILAFNLTRNFYITKILASNHLFKHAIPLLVALYPSSRCLTSPFFLLPSHFVPFSLNVNSPVIFHCSPSLSPLCLSLLSPLLFSLLSCTSFVLDYLVVSSWLCLPATG